MSEIKKRCSYCKIEKLLEEFYRQSKGSSDGRGAYCRTCSTIKHKDWVKNNRQKERAIAAKYRKTEKWKVKKRKESKKQNGTEKQKIREKIVKIRNRLKARGFNTERFKCPRSREFAKILLTLPNYCIDCNTKENLTIDHIIPLAKATEENLYDLAFGRHNLTSKMQ